MEPKLFLFIKNPRDVAQSALNSSHRWLRLRGAPNEEIAFPQNPILNNWIAYCACDGSGVYNGAFGPMRTKTRRRKKGRPQDNDDCYRELIVDGQEITSSELRDVLNTLLNSCDDLVMALRNTPIGDGELLSIIQTCGQYDVEDDTATSIEIFTGVNQAVRVTRSRNQHKTTNKMLDRSGGSRVS